MLPILLEKNVFLIFFRQAQIFEVQEKLTIPEITEVQFDRHWVNFTQVETYSWKDKYEQGIFQ